MDVQVAVSNGIQAVKLSTNKITDFLLLNWERVLAYRGRFFNHFRKIVVVVIDTVLYLAAVIATKHSSLAFCHHVMI